MPITIKGFPWNGCSCSLRWNTAPGTTVFSQKRSKFVWCGSGDWHAADARIRREGRGPLRGHDRSAGCRNADGNSPSGIQGCNSSWRQQRGGTGPSGAVVVDDWPEVFRDSHSQMIISWKDFHKDRIRIHLILAAYSFYSKNRRRGGFQHSLAAIIGQTSLYPLCHVQIRALLGSEVHLVCPKAQTLPNSRPKYKISYL